MALAAQPTTSPLDVDFLDATIAAHRPFAGGLLTILERIQANDPHNYLSTEVLQYVARRMKLPLAQLYSVVTFYAFFNLEPQGKNVVCICRGTACHTRGSRDLLESSKLHLGLLESAEDEDGADKLSLTTPNRKFTLRTVACFGQCALAPVIEINNQIRGHVHERELRKEIERLDQED